MIESFAVRLDAFAHGGVNEQPPYILRGNAYPQGVALYITREAAQRMADQCPKSYRARVVAWRV